MSVRLSCCWSCEALRQFEASMPPSAASRLLTLDSKSFHLNQKILHVNFHGAIEKVFNPSTCEFNASHGQVSSSAQNEQHALNTGV